MESPEAKLKRKNLFLKAKLAQETERYDHILLFIREILRVTSPEEDLSPKERCLLAAAFKNIVSGLRIARRMIVEPTQSCCGDGPGALAATAAFLLVIKTEIANACTKFLQLIDRRLLPSAITDDAKVFYLTLKGDFNWYLAEVKGEKGRDAQVTIDAYKDALVIAAHLGFLNPCRLALELSMTEFIFQHLHKPLKARRIAEQALRQAYMESLSRPAVSTLCFEGGIQLHAKLSSLKHRLDDQLKKTNAAGNGNVRRAMPPHIHGALTSLHRYSSLQASPESQKPLPPESQKPLPKTAKGKAAAITLPAGLAYDDANSSDSYQVLPVVSTTATPSSSSTTKDIAATTEGPMGANQAAAGTITGNIVAAANAAGAAAINGLLAFITCCCCRGF